MQDPKLELLYSPSKWVKRLPSEKVEAAHVETTARISEDVQRTIPFEKDIVYGSRNNQKVDIFGKDTIPKEAPVFVYLHGGYWQALDKNISSYCVPPLYQSLIRVIVAGYDLAPSVSMEIIVEEIKELGLFVLNMAKRNGCKNVWFGGHSAGAHLTTTLLSSDWLNQLDNDLKVIFKGVVLISGIYDITPLLNTSVNDELGMTRDVAFRFSPLFDQDPISTDSSFKILMAIAENDSPAFHEQHSEYIKLLKKKKLDVESLLILEMDHFDIVENLCSFSHVLTERIIKLILKSNSS